MVPLFFLVRHSFVFWYISMVPLLLVNGRIKKYRKSLIDMYCFTPELLLL